MKNVSNLSNTDKHGTTSIKINEFSYTWTIKDFSSFRSKVGEALESPQFTNGSDEENEWQIRIFPHGYNYDWKDYLSLTMCLNNRPPTRKAHLIVSLVDKTGKENAYAESSFQINPSTTEQIRFPQLVRSDDVYDEEKDLLPDGNLIIKCIMDFEAVINHSDDIAVSNINSIKDKVCDDFEQLLEDKKFGDVKLVVADKEFFVYKGILAARSPVFAAMFEHDMKENCENLVEIIDIDPQVMQELLRYIYCGRVKNIEILAPDLLAAANQYALDGLKAHCEDELINGLNVVNIGEILILADRYKTDALKMHAIKFLVSNAKEVFNTDKFKTDMKNSVSLLLEVLKQVLNA